MFKVLNNCLRITSVVMEDPEILKSDQCRAFLRMEMRQSDDLAVGAHLVVYTHLRNAPQNLQIRLLGLYVLRCLQLSHSFSTLKLLIRSFPIRSACTAVLAVSTLCGAFLRDRCRSPSCLCGANEESRSLGRRYSIGTTVAKNSTPGRVGFGVTSQRPADVLIRDRIVCTRFMVTAPARRPLRRGRADRCQLRR